MKRIKELSITASILIQACAADPSDIALRTSTPDSIHDVAAESAIGARIILSYDNFYTLLEPNENQCAGDTRKYYKPFDYQSSTGETLASLEATVDTYAGTQEYYASTGTHDGPVSFSTSTLVDTMTNKPSFIKNVSVDMTDAMSKLTGNNGYMCSIGDSEHSLLPAPSNCASFDYGAVGGAASTLGGSLILIGGIRDYNYAGIKPSDTATSIEFRGETISCGPVGTSAQTDCSAGMYALNVDSLPATAATDPPSALAPGLTSATSAISTWSNITTSGPIATAGAASAFNSTTKKLVHFGGVGPLTKTNGTGPACDKDETWVFDFAQQSWTQKNSTPAITEEIQNLLECQICPVHLECDADSYIFHLPKDPGERSRFGYAAVPFMALSQISNDAEVNTASVIDKTDRILIASGKTDSSGINNNNEFIYKFNPTFGPEFINVLQIGATPASNKSLAQWADSYHTQLLSGQYTSDSRFKPRFHDQNDSASAGTGASGVYDPGFAPAIKNNSNSIPIGHAISIGGFPGPQTTNTPATGRITYSKRQDPTNLLPASDVSAMPFLPPINPDGTYNADTAGSNIRWGTGYLDTTWGAAGLATLTDRVPWAGAASVVPGFALNSFFYLGGTSSTGCRDYITATTCTKASVAKYYESDATLAEPTHTSLAGQPAGQEFPSNIAMTTARGESAAGDIIVLAWGGLTAAQTTGDSKLYVLYNSGGPKSQQLNTLNGPQYPLVGAAMTYSHVTRKFYLFGGYQFSGTKKALANTWELNITGTAGAYIATWKQLNISGSITLTCAPECPIARYGHRMVEVNYNNSDPADLQPTSALKCSNTAPCSFGIFMEGGETNSGTLLSDRWMFDPTANNGLGHWQKVDHSPPRRSTAMAALSYNVPAQLKTVHRAVAFGGETGLLSPPYAAKLSNGTKKYFVPPTLGDTLMYDFEKGTWNRVELLGKGYVNGPPAALTSTWETKQAFDTNGADTGELGVLSPPALSGAVMVTRTHELPSPTAQPSPLPVPEIYLVGGRTKDGLLPNIGTVYKFCSGSPGEHQQGAAVSTTDDTRCESVVTRADYVGRWLKKSPYSCATPLGASIAPDDCNVFNAWAGGWTTTRSFMGAAAYNPKTDKILLFGGLSTASATATTPTVLGTDVYEYSPPTSILSGAANNTWKRHGYWSKIPACQSAANDLELPDGRYGHSMAFDVVKNRIIVTGGYDSEGTPLKTALDTYDIPEVWTATRLNSGSAYNQYPCYYWEKKTVFGNTATDEATAPPTTGLSHASSVFIQSAGYNSGFYTTYDESCTGAGPIASIDAATTKLLAGGVYIDINRSSLKSDENLLLNLTYIPLSENNKKPDQTNYSSTDNAILNIHLMKIGSTESTLQQIIQPRHLFYSSEDQYPKTVKKLAVSAPADGIVRQEQILIPLSIDPYIDRIRIERYSGSVVLIDATLFRLGTP